MKKATIFLLALTLLLSACAPHYRADPSISAICEVSLGALEREDYRLDTAGILEDYITLPDTVTEYAVFYSTETENADELGIFLCRDTEDAIELEKTLRTSYLDAFYEKNREFYDSYIPGETPKLKDAQVRRFGIAVAYAMLSPADQSAFFHAIDKYMQE